MNLVTNQEYPNFEYMVIDGGSTDGTVDILRKYDQQIDCWTSAPDKGQAHASIRVLLELAAAYLHGSIRMIRTKRAFLNKLPIYLINNRG